MIAKLMSATVLLLVGCLLQYPSPSPPHPIQPQQKQTNAPNSSRARTADAPKIRDFEESTSYGWIIPALTFGLLVLAAAQFWAMHRQAEYMRKGLLANITSARAATRSANAATAAADTARNALKITERANVALAALSIASDRSGIEVLVRNYGRTQSEQVSIGLRLTLSGSKTADVYIPPRADAFIAPGDTQTAFFGGWLGRLPPQSLESVYDRSSTLRFEATIDYTDVFGDHHRRIHRGEFHPEFGFLVSK